MIKFYYHPAPNPDKVALYLEETGLPYEMVPVDIRKGEQHASAYKAINPNAKVPALKDGEIVIFDSNAILLYLAEKTGYFFSLNTPTAHAKLYSWLMFIASGVGPYSGQAVHFKHYADYNTYAINRYDFEAWRHWNIVNAHLERNCYMSGDQYSLVDMAVWGWARLVPFVLDDTAWKTLPYLKRLVDEINARPAAQRVNSLKERYPFKEEVDEETRRALFPHNTI